MSADNQAQFELTTEVQGALANVKEFESAAVESVEHVTEIFEKFKLAGEAALVFFGVEKLKEFASEAIDAAAAQEDGQRRLATAMQLSGEYTAEAKEEMDGFAESLQANSRFSEEAATSALSLAKTFGVTNDQAQTLVQTAADMATMYGTDLDTQVNKLTRTLTGNVGRMAQTIPELKKFTEEQLKAGAAVDYLAERFGGAAAAGINDYAGATKQASNAEEDLIKSLGHFIIDSPMVIARIQAMTETWRDAKDWVEENHDAIQDYVDVGIKALVLAVPVAATVLEVLMHAMETASIVGADALGALLTVADLVASGINDAFGGIVSDVLLVIDGMAALAAAVPGSASTFAMMGVDIDDVSEKAHALKTGFDEFRMDGVQAIEDVHESVSKFAEAGVEQFDEVNDKVDGVVQHLYDGAQKIIDADGKVGDSAVASGGRRDGASQRSIKELQKLEAELKKLDDAIFNSIADPSAKAQKEFEDHINEIDRLENAGVITAQAAEERRVQVASIYADKRIKIAKDEWGQAEQEATTALNKIEKRISDAAANPFTLIFAVDDASEQDALDRIQGNFESLAERLKSSGVLKNATAEQVEEGIGAAADLGGKLFSALQQGSDGPRQFGAAMAGAVGAALGTEFGGPALGAALGGLFQQAFLFASQDPDVQGAQVAGFIEASPKITENIIAAGPAIARSIMGEMKNPAFWKEIVDGAFNPELSAQFGKLLGTHFGQSLNANRIFATVPAEWHKDMSWLTGAGKQWAVDLSKFPDALNKAVGDLQAFGDSFRIEVKETPKHITDAFHDGVDYLTHETTAAIKKAGADMALETRKSITEPFTDVLKPLGDAFAFGSKQFVGAVVQAFKDAVSQIHLPEFTTPGWLQDFKGAVDKLSGLTGAGGGGGGGASGVAQQIINPGGVFGRHAAGLASVPEGFPNDTYLAGLTSHERVVAAPTNDALSKMVADYPASQQSMLALLGNVVALLGQPMTISGAKVTVDGRAFADLTLQLNRNNARLRA